MIGHLTDADLDRIIPNLWPPNATYNLAGPAAAYHLTSDRGGCCDPGAVWCGAEYDPRRNETEDPSAVACEACLYALREYARKAEWRLLELVSSSITGYPDALR